MHIKMYHLGNHWGVKRWIFYRQKFSTVRHHPLKVSLATWKKEGKRSTHMDSEKNFLNFYPFTRSPRSNFLCPVILILTNALD